MTQRMFVAVLTAWAVVVLVVGCDSALAAGSQLTAQVQRPLGGSQVIPPGGSQLPPGATQTPPGTIQTLPGAPTTFGASPPPVSPPTTPSAPVTQPPLPLLNAASEYSYEWARRQQLASDAVQGHLGVPIFWELWSPWPSF